MFYRQLSCQVGSDVGSFDLHSDEAEYPFVLMAACVRNKVIKASFADMCK